MLAVVITVAWNAYAAWRQTMLTRRATLYQLLGVIAVVQSRLAAIQADRSAPSDGYAAFERLLSVAYSGDVASLMAGKATVQVFFTELSGLENELGSMRTALRRAGELSLSAHKNTAVQERIKVELDKAATAARRAAEHLARMRAHCSDEEAPKATTP